ncbi:N-terminal acetyltransferase complex catalytic [Salix suchowensis]|nr:N-terminal acetyltransferase complex catalytic [Salix suchowensis]
MRDLRYDVILQLIPGHEAVGTIVELGKNVKGFEIGDRCVADVGITVSALDLTVSSVFSSYTGEGSATIASTAAVANRSCAKTSTRVVSPRTAASPTMSSSMYEYSRATHTDTLFSQQKKLYKINNLSDEDATLLEPAACAIHGLDKLSPPVGVELNGASRVVIAANKGIKMDIAKQLDAGDEYIELDRQNPGPQWQKLKDDNPYGFDVVVEATGVEALANESINYVRRAIIGSFSQTFCFPRAVAYLDSGKIRVKGMVTDVFKLEEYQAALDKMNSRGAVKICIKP